MDEEQTSTIDDTTEDLDTEGAKASAKSAYSTGKDIAKKIKDSSNKKDDEEGEGDSSKGKKEEPHSSDSAQTGSESKTSTKGKSEKADAKSPKQGANTTKKGADTAKQGADAAKKSADTAKAAKAAKTAKQGADAAKAASAASGAAGGISSLVAFFATPVGWVILIILAIILIAVLLIGAIGFFMTMPGLMQEKIGNFFQDATSSFMIDPTEDKPIIGDEQMEQAKLDLANYINDMGYNLVGYGFLNSVEKDENGKITKIGNEKNDYLYAYILSNERMYSLNNANNNVGGKLKTEALNAILKTVAGKIHLPLYRWDRVVDAFLPEGVRSKCKKGYVTYKLGFSRTNSSRCF